MSDPDLTYKGHAITNDYIIIRINIVFNDTRDEQSQLSEVNDA